MRALKVIVTLCVLLAASVVFADSSQTGIVTVGAGGQYECPATAMDDLSEWCVNPSVDNRCVMKIAPGTYDVTHTNGLRMKPFVDIIGSGVGQTVIKGNIQGYRNAVVVGSSDATLSSLTVENSSTGDYAVAIYNKSCRPLITDVHATASGSRSNSAMYNDNATPVLNNVIAKAMGGVVSYAMKNINASRPVIRGGSFTAEGANENFGFFNIAGSEVRIEENCLVQGDSAQIVTMKGKALPVYETLGLLSPANKQ